MSKPTSVKQVLQELELEIDKRWAEELSSVRHRAGYPDGDDAIQAVMKALHAMAERLDW